MIMLRQVTQYLGLKYASLSHRFGPPELYSGDGSSEVIDGTKLGFAKSLPILIIAIETAQDIAD